MPLTPHSPPPSRDARSDEMLLPENDNFPMSAAGSSSNSIIFDYCDKDLINNRKSNAENDRPLKRLYPISDNWDGEEPSPESNSFGASLPQASVCAWKVADAVIKHARENNIINVCDIACLDCQMFPVHPVTGVCGHTRCTKCVKDNGACPCGTPPRETLHVNTLVQDLVERLVQQLTKPDSGTKSCFQMMPKPSTQPGSKNMAKRMRRHRSSSSKVRPQMVTPDIGEYKQDPIKPSPFCIQIRFDKACNLISSNRYFEAAPLLAHVAVSKDHIANNARSLLAQVIMALIKKRNRLRLTRQLFHMVQQNSVTSWLELKDLECSLCCSTFNKPVTTPCGHNFCKTCIERSLDYWKMCPLCKSSLDNFNIFSVRETTAITAALQSLNAVQPPVKLDPDEIRLLICTLAYPGVACPLFVIEPRCWMMVRRVLEADRRFGMLAHDKNNGAITSTGTILEIRDCVYFEDGRSIITTIGVSRFKVIEKDNKDGCEVARYEPVVDIYPQCETHTWLLEVVNEVSAKAWKWVQKLDSGVIFQIESSFGKKPDFLCQDEDTWKSTDGPAWLWWLICILPLRFEIKMMLLNSDDLVKRMWTVCYTLDTIEKESVGNIPDLRIMLDVISQDELEWLARRNIVDFLND